MTDFACLVLVVVLVAVALRRPVCVVRVQPDLLQEFPEEAECPGGFPGLPGLPFA